jgi:hypothetical protein
LHAHKKISEKVKPEPIIQLNFLIAVRGKYTIKIRFFWQQSGIFKLGGAQFALTTDREESADIYGVETKNYFA